jgi:hypothetical protein
MSQTEMNRNHRQTLSDARDSFAAVRESIEQEFAPLSKQQPRVFQLALNEAEAIAWQTGFARLIFPQLAVEKIQAVGEWHARQKSIRRAEPIMSFAE